jgi:hypothetical protein
MEIFYWFGAGILFFLGIVAGYFILVGGLALKDIRDSDKLHKEMIELGKQGKLTGDAEKKRQRRFDQIDRKLDEISRR